MKQLKYLVIHCTATRRSQAVTSDDIRQWHLMGNGWKQVGYTDLIHLNGSIERMVENNEDANVDPWEITNGAAGYNSVSRHICYVGGLGDDLKPKDTRTEQQLHALRDYVWEFHLAHPDVAIVGHNELNSGKACPCFDVQEWLKSIGIYR